ncbi:type II toxin-antitoxin system VapB family antitoxin [Dankookia sp. GCM10030260]|uniref:type II toxin-antitoxin system VapB family antitoxin n=1 Tax=Dankookia sp. GCM10030260 TaxID=3273390 RepID=UPI003610441C
MGQLNIKDEALIAEAKALAELLGTTTTDAIRRAVNERLARERVGDDEDKRRRFDAIMAIAREASTLFPPGTTSDHSEFYDEDGLPR